jgi:hypothetical protein
MFTTLTNTGDFYPVALNAIKRYMGAGSTQGWFGGGDGRLDLFCPTFKATIKVPLRNVQKKLSGKN